MPSRSPEFRYTFANGVGMGLNDNEVRLMFSFCEDLTKPEEAIESAGIILTHRTAKLLARMLSDTLDHYESITGSPIPFDEAQYNALKGEALVNPIQTSSVVSQP